MPPIGPQDSRSGNEKSQITPGSIIGEYQVTEEIGEGGMGMVYGAVHPVIGKRVAVKVLKTKIGSDEHLVERFIREAISSCDRFSRCRKINTSR